MAPVAHAEGWETFPHGRLFGASFTRPNPQPDRACSFTRPLCVHGDTRSGAPVLEVLSEAERAYDTLAIQMSLPPPVFDGSAGGSPALDIYLIPRSTAANTASATPAQGAPKTTGAHNDTKTTKTDASKSPKTFDAWAGSDSWYRIGLDLPERMSFDKAPAFALLDPSLADGCTRRTAIHRIVATAMFAAVDGAETGGMFASSAAYTAALHTGCYAQVLGGFDLAQSRPQDVLIKAGEIDDPDASILLPWFMDGSYGAPESPPGSLVTAMWFGSSQNTGVDATRFHNERDPFFVLAAMAKGREKKLLDILGDVAIARAFFGERSDGAHLDESLVTGKFGRIRFDAVMPLETLPRRIAFSPLEPSGSTYTWVDLTNAPANTRVILRAAWERPVTMRWFAVRVGKDGEEISRLEIPNEKGVFQVERTILELENLSGLIIVGVNLGEIAPDVPFHADEAPHVAHGGTLSVFKE